MKVSVPSKVLVVGLGATGEAVARHMSGRGSEVTAVDDEVGGPSRQAADRLGVELLEAPGAERLRSLATDADLVVVSPGVPASHPVLGLDVPIVSEVELAWRSSAVPVIAVTGTNGKTTVTLLVTRMLRQAGIDAVAAGNIGTPLIDAVSRGPEIVVAEVSSFQLALTAEFRPRVATWLNVTEDHLDWHPTVEHYIASKAKIWANQRGGDVAVANAEDQVVMRCAAAAPVAPVTFGLGVGAYRLVKGFLTTPGGERVVQVERMARSLPHDIANGLAASATALAAGATTNACRQVLESFDEFPHRVELVSEAGGVRYYDDSKSTTPASVVAAMSGLGPVVLILGGRNKGLDLSPVRRAADHVRSVVAIGEAAEDVKAVFSGLRKVETASSMRDAVRLARDAAKPGDAVLLSPGCASFDWYGSYAERGEDFAREVRAMVGRSGDEARSRR